MREGGGERRSRPRRRRRRRRAVCPRVARRRAHLPDHRVEDRTHVPVSATAAASAVSDGVTLAEEAIATLAPSSSSRRPPPCPRRVVRARGARGTSRFPSRRRGGTRRAVGCPIRTSTMDVHDRACRLYPLTFASPSSPSSRPSRRTRPRTSSSSGPSSGCARPCSASPPRTPARTPGRGPRQSPSSQWLLELRYDFDRSSAPPGTGTA